jgi:mycothiol system anti-sigma-R factor
MSCLESLDQIFAYIDGQISEKEIMEEIEEHLQHCKRCWDVVDFEKRIQSFVKDQGCDEKMPNDVLNRAHNILTKFKSY